MIGLACFAKLSFKCGIRGTKVIAAWIDGIKFGAEMEALSLASLA
jgi:hypothetical protein